ncbi:hypothetical protein TPHA_0G01130 [Tetrapisispora phaffii CBS 4417]|uniref:Uncharacterized protein n=1 Tax=Tetrapisispora phaffii (strain ATCC 24235 / CBS 4417 / NBRC 1672 / NRRL Y-8282 / UCD 70-5) TaxID=1071381 RepID=G8BVM2_TETPH|nr:hypothetical protein TPHA_0G01130 [Tetrapisispora phaffii CBS 4417]CCE63950.1 hypothetical protein TPHA_0G01130 [Tetrapisispora phaffii CBS 4417]
MSSNKVNAVSDIVDVKFSNGENFVSTINDKVAKHKKDIKHLKTIDHIQKYPLVQQTETALNNILVSRIVIEKTLPVAEYIIHSRPVEFFSPALIVPDTIANTSLNVTEKIVPSIKTKTYQRLGEEAMIPCVFVRKVNDSTIQFIDNKITDPNHQAIKRWRVYYNQYVNTNNKPLIRGTFDPLFSKLNKHLEKSWTKALENDNFINKNSYCCEFDKSIVLTINIIAQKTKDVNNKILSYPKNEINYVKKVNNTTIQKLEEENNFSLGNVFKVLKETVKTK